eukprot:PITA_21494
MMFERDALLENMSKTPSNIEIAELKPSWSESTQMCVDHFLQYQLQNTGDEKLIQSCKEDLTREFEMNAIGLMHYFLGLEVWLGDGELFVGQGKYTSEILQRFHMWDCNPMETHVASNWRKVDDFIRDAIYATIYRHMVSSLMYLVNIRPDMCYAVNELSQFMVMPTKLHWKAEKHVLRYLISTMNFRLWYRRTDGVKLQGFINAY